MTGLKHNLPISEKPLPEEPSLRNTLEEITNDLMAVEPPSTRVEVQHNRDSLMATAMRPGDYCLMIDDEGRVLREQVYLCVKVGEPFFLIKGHGLDEETEDMVSSHVLLLVNVQTGRGLPARSLQRVLRLPRITFEIG